MLVADDAGIERTQKVAETRLPRYAQFVIDRGMGRKIDKEDAMRVLDRSEEAGLVHCTNNRQEIDFLCNTE